MSMPSSINMIMNIAILATISDAVYISPLVFCYIAVIINIEFTLDYLSFS